MRTFTKQELDKILDNHKIWLSSGGEKGERADFSYADLRFADLRNANLSNANLRYADLRYANLCYADLDFSSLPLWCGSLQANFDDKQLIQITYHLIKAGLQSNNASEETKLELIKLKDFANKFHRADECGVI
jgi:uncharacterized protein YjbI with pentapeptide repeats